MKIERFCAEEERDATIADLARKHALAIRSNVMQGHEQTLHDLGNALGDRLCDNAVMATLIRAAMTCGPLTAGQMLIDLTQKCIDSDAELEAIKEVERMESARKADPASFLPKRRAVAVFAERAV
jgi:hypothetical protein